MIDITYIYREFRKTNFSIEGIFDLVKKSLCDEISYTDIHFDPSVSRLKNILNIRKKAGKLNHITGDVSFLALGLVNKKTVWTVHDLGHLDTVSKHPLKYMLLKSLWWQYPLKIVDVVTVVSEFSRSKLIDLFHVPESKLRLIKNPIKPLFRYQEKTIINSRPHILMLGTGRHKNLGNLIEAVKGKELHLDIVGWPNEEEISKLHQYNISHNIYNRLSDEEVYALYRECDILYIASFYEGFGMPIIEAQAVGRPVITSNIGAMKEVGNGNALLVNPHDVDEIRDAIMRLCDDSDLYKNTVAVGLENTVQYDHKKIAAQYLQVYKELN